MDWLKKPVDTVIILSALGMMMLWINGRFNDIIRDTTIIKTVIVIKTIAQMSSIK